MYVAFVATHVCFFCLLMTMMLTAVNLVIPATAEFFKKCRVRALLANSLSSNSPYEL